MPTSSLPGGGSADQTSVHSLWIAERSGGTDQLAGAPEYGAVFALDQPMIDAIWDLTYGARDPGRAAGRNPVTGLPCPPAPNPSLCKPRAWARARC